MGAAFCIVELTSALSLTGLLLCSCKLPAGVPLVLIFLLIYTFMYVLALIFAFILGDSKLVALKASSWNAH